jgi:2-polyprenyl-3-methyl-5-hydroxy-6-metoxy-1,4-benzoquinol methylase
VDFLQTATFKGYDSIIKNKFEFYVSFKNHLFKINSRMNSSGFNSRSLQQLLGKIDMYLLDLLQKGYFNSPLKILDAGCGSGRNMMLLAKLGHQLTGVDQDRGVILELKDQISRDDVLVKQISVGVGEMGNLNYTDEEFDMVICNAVLHFANDKNHFESMFRDLVRVVKSGGVLFLRFVSSHTMINQLGEFNKVMSLPDQTERFVVDYQWLKTQLISKLNLVYLEEFKTVNIDDKRTMTTLILATK